MSGRLYFLIGLPRSGKSTIAKRWLNNEINITNYHCIVDKLACEISFPRVVVNADRIRLAMGHRWNGVVEPYVAATCDTMIRALLYDHDVLIDETHTSARSILRTLQISSIANWHFVDALPGVCQQRAIDTGQRDLTTVIGRMYTNLCKLCNCGTMVSIKGELPRVIDELKEQASANKGKFERIVD